MKVAYLVSQYPAASHTFIRREIEAVRKQGIEIDTFSVRTPSAPELESSRDRLAFENTYYLLPPSIAHLFVAHFLALITRPISYARVLKLAVRHRVPGVRALLWALFHFVEAIQLARKMEHHNISHLHNHFANSGATVGLLASQFLNVPWSLTLHGISETDYPAGLLLAAKIQAASFVACVSDFGRAQAMRISAPEHWHKLFIVRCALDFNDLPKKQIKSASGPVRVICVGRLSPEKGHLGLLKAFANALGHGMNAELVLVGDGPESKRIDQTITQLDLSQKVRRTDALNELSTLKEIAAAEVLVLASFMEGLPVVLMEAMALGLPVIATRVAGIPELVNDRENGLLFNPANWDDLANCLFQLCSDVDLRRRLGLAGYQKVYEMHNVISAFEPLIKYFKSTLASKSKKF